mmetsp:Transcript_27171/g.80935  ORF Transcript_27171/g.80935 Transcript_27171/m.80935 type:complete len:249 (-) Transcript_27171:22-768(-)
MKSVLRRIRQTATMSRGMPMNHWIQVSGSFAASPSSSSSSSSSTTQNGSSSIVDISTCLSFSFCAGVFSASACGPAFGVCDTSTFGTPTCTSTLRIDTSVVRETPTLRHEFEGVLRLSGSQRSGSQRSPGAFAPCTSGLRNASRLRRSSSCCCAICLSEISRCCSRRLVSQASLPSMAGAEPVEAAPLENPLPSAPRGAPMPLAELAAEACGEQPPRPRPGGATGQPGSETRDPLADREGALGDPRKP